MNKFEEIENIEPASAEEYTRRHPGKIDAIRVAVRKELDASQTNGTLSGDTHSSLNLLKVTSDLPLIESDSLNCVSKCDKCSVSVTHPSIGFRIFSGVNRLSCAHAITSLLVVGGTIIASVAASHLFSKYKPLD